MLYYAAKIGLSAVIIVVIAEVAKRHSTFAALIASLPLTSLLAFVWLHLDGTPPGQIAKLAREIFWLIIPSFALFAALPLLLKHGVGFWLSLAASIALTVASYFALLPLLRRFGVDL